MNLLPKTTTEFSKSDYWNTFFKKRGEKSFEWYGEYLDLCSILNKYIKPKDKILVVGCGNSKLSMDMYDTGYKELTNIDISNVVINQMIELNRISRPEMEFIQMDATEMSFADEQFSVVLDKGTLDALMTSDKQEVIETVTKYFQEICRVLRNGGRYVCISLLQEHILKFVVEFFPKNKCMLRIVRCIEAEAVGNNQDNDSSFPIFAIVVTKFKTLNQPILEICMAGDKIERVSSVTEILDTVDSVQKTALIFNSLRKKSFKDKNEELKIDLYDSKTGKQRYTIYLIEQSPLRGNSKYGGFIIPCGRETEWLFSTKDGRRKLLSSAKYNRLAVVTLHRDQEYESLQKIQAELDSTLLNLKPEGMTEKIPYLSLGPDVGKRNLVAKGVSKFSGEYRVEDVEYEGNKIFRRLIFMNNQNIVQSEAILEIGGEKNKIDLHYLACEHHIYISIGVKFSLKSVPNGKFGDVLIIGLGGGGLCSFIHNMMRNAIIHAVEIDPEMSNVAKNYFDLAISERIKIFIEDGLTFLERVTQKYKAIVFDVDNKELSIGMNCPPKEFLEENILDKVKILIEPDGIFILNLVCRDEKIRDSVISKLKANFKSICFYKLEEEVNEIIFCCNNDDQKYELKKWRGELEKSGKELYNLVKKKKIKQNNFDDLADFFNNLSLS